jgi:hypothetical protein
VTYDDAIDLWKTDPQHRVIPRNVQPPLARTCKQIQHEVLPIFYAENTFVLIGGIRGASGRFEDGAALAVDSAER